MTYITERMKILAGISEEADNDAEYHCVAGGENPMFIHVSDKDKWENGKQNRHIKKYKKDGDYYVEIAHQEKKIDGDDHLPYAPSVRSNSMY